MTKLILTDEKVGSLRVTAGTEDYYDTSDGVPFSFGVRVGKTGKSWWTRYTLYGTRRRYPLGHFPQVKREEALWEAFEVHQKVRQGLDPQVERQQKRMAKTVEQVVEVYLKEIDGVLSPRTCETYLESIEKDILPNWRRRALESLTRGEIRRLLRAMKDQGARARTNTALTVLSGLFKLAEAEEWCEGNPCIGLPRVWKQGKRTDFFTAEEIHRMWHALNRTFSIVGEAWFVLLLTGQRPGEVRLMDRHHIKGPWWELPKTKNGRPHLVYLSEPVREVIERLAEFRPSSSTGDMWPVFPGATPGSFKDWGKFGRDLRKKVGITHMRPHTARHTFITWLRSQDVDMYLIKALVNHTTSADVTAGYDHYRYRPQRKEWFTRYGEYIMRCVRGEYSEDDLLLSA